MCNNSNNFTTRPGHTFIHVAAEEGSCERAYTPGPFLDSNTNFSRLKICRLLTSFPLVWLQAQMKTSISLFAGFMSGLVPYLNSEQFRIIVLSLENVLERQGLRGSMDVRSGSKNWLKKGRVGLGWVGSSFTERTGGMRTGGWWSLVVLNGVNDRLLNCIFEFSTLVVFAKLNEIILLA